jgi:hypothetical protein
VKTFQTATLICFEDSSYVGQVSSLLLVRKGTTRKSYAKAIKYSHQLYTRVLDVEKESRSPKLGCQFLRSLQPSSLACSCLCSLIALGSFLADRSYGLHISLTAMQRHAGTGYFCSVVTCTWWNLSITGRCTVANNQSEKLLLIRHGMHWVRIRYNHGMPGMSCPDLDH